MGSSAGMVYWLGPVVAFTGKRADEGNGLLALEDKALAGWRVVTTFVISAADGGQQLWAVWERERDASDAVTHQQKIDLYLVGMEELDARKRD